MDLLQKEVREGYSVLENKTKKKKNDVEKRGWRCFFQINLHPENRKTAGGQTAVCDMPASFHLKKQI